MPVYAFRGRNVQTNESIMGERSSASPQALAAALRREQIAPISIREKSGLSFHWSPRRKVSQSEVAIFTRQFAVMLNAGLPLLCSRSLRVTSILRRHVFMSTSLPR